MNAHTPGPWTVRGNSIVADETDDRLEMRVRIHSGNRDDIKANARLIAAAPDLLAALRTLLDIPSGQYSECGEYEPAAAAARAAIARATGAAT